MSESIWEELVRSPLDPDPNEEPSRLASLLPFLGVAVAGLLIGLFVLGASAEPAGTTTLAMTTSTTTTEPPDPEPEVPAGYIDTDGIGLQAIAAYSRQGKLYIAVSEATRSDLVATEASAFHSSDWVLAGDGFQIAASRAIESPLAPGMRVIEFPGVSALPATVPELIVRQGSEMVVRTGCQGCGAVSANAASGEIVLDSLERPFLLEDPLLIDVGYAITLSIDHLEFTDDWGYVEWHIIDQNEARAHTSVRILFEGTDDPGIDDLFPTQLIPENLFGPGMQNPTMPNSNSFTREGWLLLDRVGELISDENTPTSLILQWGVEWQHPVGEPITLPLDGITDLGELD